MGGETTLTLTADDDSEYDIYETCTKTVKVKPLNHLRMLTSH